jgi:signal transduction histidine kinase
MLRHPYKKSGKEMISSFLARRVLTSLGVRIAIITLFFSGLSYYISYMRFQAETEQQLAQFVKSRSQLESDLFTQAQKNVVLVRNSYLRQLEQNKHSQPEERFSQLLEQQQDGVWRIRSEFDDYRYKATVAVYPSATLDPFFKREVLLAYDLISQFGPAFRLRYYSTFIDLGENEATILYSPDINYAKALLPIEVSMNWNAESFVYLANSGQKDKTYWTDIYYDSQTAKWLVSVIAPIVDHGRYYGRAGMDVLLSQLIDSINVNSIAGSYNMILGKNGELIAHPSKMQEIRNAKGYLPINYLQDAELSQIFEAVTQNKMAKGLVKTKDGKLLLGVAALQGTKWLLITAYPKKLLQKKAAAAASIVLILGLITLLIQIFFVAKVLKKDIATPIHTLQDAVNRLAHGEEITHLNIKRGDEIGALAHDFELMANDIQRYQDELEMQVKVRTDALTQHNQTLIDTNAELIQLDQEKNTVLMIVAHDLKRSITHIKEMVVQLQKRISVWPQEKSVAKLNVIDMLSTHLLQLLRNVLDLNVLEEGGYPITLEAIALQTVLQQLRQYYQTQLELKRQVLVIQGADIEVQADATVLWQVLDNLLSNACKYTPQHGQIKITVEPKEKRVHIIMEDQGPGIALQDFDKLFQKFSRLSTSPTGGEYSTGLGLFIVAHLLKLIEGDIRCESQFGQGAKFIVSLPVATITSLK